MGFLQDWKEKRKKQRMEEYIQKTAQTEQEKLKYQDLKKTHDEKEALRKKKEELKEYKRKQRELRYGKIKKGLGSLFKKKPKKKKRRMWGIILRIIFAILFILILYFFFLRDLHIFPF